MERVPEGRVNGLGKASTVPAPYYLPKPRRTARILLRWGAYSRALACRLAHRRDSRACEYASPTGVIYGESTRLRVGDETLTVPRYGRVLVGPDQLRQVFNDTDAEVLWLIVGAPEELEFLPGAKTKPDLSLIDPVDPKQLPKELAGVEWPPTS